MADDLSLPNSGYFAPATPVASAPSPVGAMLPGGVRAVDFNDQARQQVLRSQATSAAGAQAIEADLPLVNGAKQYNQSLADALAQQLPAMAARADASVAAANTISDAQNHLEANRYLPSFIGKAAGLIGSVTGDKDWQGLDDGYQQRRMQQAATMMQVNSEANKTVGDYIAQLRGAASSGQEAAKNSLGVSRTLEESTAGTTAGLQSAMQAEHTQKLINLQGMDEKALGTAVQNGFDPGMVKDELARRTSLSQGLEHAALLIDNAKLTNQSAGIALGQQKLDDVMKNHMSLGDLDQLIKAAQENGGKVNFRGVELTDTKLRSYRGDIESANAKRTGDLAELQLAQAEVGSKIQTLYNKDPQGNEHGTIPAMLKDTAVAATATPVQMGGIMTKFAAASQLAGVNPIAASKALDEINKELGDIQEATLKNVPPAEVAARKQKYNTGDIANAADATRFLNSNVSMSAVTPFPPGSIYADTDATLRKAVNAELQKNAHAFPGMDSKALAAGGLSMQDMLRFKPDESLVVQSALTKNLAAARGTLADNAKSMYVKNVMLHLASPGQDATNPRPPIDAFKQFFSGASISQDYMTQNGRLNIQKIFDTLSAQDVANGTTNTHTLATTLSSPANMRGFAQQDKEANPTVEAAAWRKVLAGGDISSFLTGLPDAVGKSYKAAQITAQNIAAHVGAAKPSALPMLTGAVPQQPTHPVPPVPEARPTQPVPPAQAVQAPGSAYFLTRMLGR